MSEGSFIGSGPAFSARFVAPSDSLVSLHADGDTELPLRIEVLDYNGLLRLALRGGVVGGLRRDRRDREVRRRLQRQHRQGDLHRADSRPRLLLHARPIRPMTASAASTSCRCRPASGPRGTSCSVQLLTGPASAAQSAWTFATSMRPDDQSYFTITVKDAWGNPLGGHRLMIAATSGVITTEGVTDSYGVAGGLSFIAPDLPGTVYVEVRDVTADFNGNMILRKSVTIAE